jgi:hypothetical protein
VAIAFNEGNIDVALARGVSSEFLLGRYLVADERITQSELEDFLRSGSADNGWLGERLLQSGRIRVEDLRKALTRQTSEIIYEILRWADGSFRFEFDVVPPEGESARLGLTVESMVLEGFRRVDEWRLIEQEVASFDEVLARDEAVIEAVGKAQLSAEEAAVVAVIDGSKTVRDIVHSARMSSFDTCRILYRLLRAKIVRRRSSS